MIDVENLTKHYGIHTALDDVSFKARDGEITGLLGPNGAGKTTTMRILTGFMPPSSGRAIVAGHDVTEDSMAVRQRVGYMPERVPIYPDMTVEGYVSFWAKMRGINRPGPRVREVLERVQLHDRRKSLVRNLSKGMRQRLGLAQALVHEPEVVILDEPTIGIDPHQVIEVREMVRELAADHTVLFSTHILSEAEQVCDRVVIVNRGRVAAYGKPEALRRQLDPGNQLYVEIGGAEPQRVRNLLSKISGVQAVEPVGGGFNVVTKQGVDVRPAIVQRVTETNYHLLEIRPAAMTLEDIFLSLVQEEA